MSAREKRLALFLGVVAGGVGTWKLILPTVHEKLFAVEEDNRATQARIDGINAELAEVVEPRMKYESYVARTGSADPGKVKLDLHARLNELANESGLQSPRLSPLPINEYRPPGSRKRTDIQEVSFSLVAEGSLESVITFLKSFYELPYVARLESLKLEPQAGRNRQSGMVHIRATIGALVPPANEVAAVNPEHWTQPGVHVKHRDLQYASIWERDPFTEYVPPPPPPRVVEPRTPVVSKPATPVEPEVGDPDAASKVIRMTLDYGTEEQRIQEALVFNNKDQSSSYVAVGEELDGGTVRLVSAWGVVAQREKGDELVYGIGRTLAESIPFETSLGSYPEVYYAYEQLKAEEEALDETPGDDEANDGDEATMSEDAFVGPPVTLWGPDPKPPIPPRVNSTEDEAESIDRDAKEERSRAMRTRIRNRAPVKQETPPRRPAPVSQESPQ